MSQIKRFNQNRYHYKIINRLPKINWLPQINKSNNHKPVKNVNGVK